MSRSINVLYSKDSQNQPDYFHLERENDCAPESDSEREIGRADSYAFWDDLKDLVNKEHKSLPLRLFGPL